MQTGLQQRQNGSKRGWKLSLPKLSLHRIILQHFLLDCFPAFFLLRRYPLSMLGTYWLKLDLHRKPDRSLNWWHIHLKTNMAASSAAGENETSKLYSIVSLLLFYRRSKYTLVQRKNILTCTLSLLCMQWKGNWQKNAERWHWKETC